MDTKSKSAKPWLKRIAALMAGGVLALGVALPVSADHGHDRGNGYAYGKYRDYGDDDFERPGRGYGHYKHKHRKHKKVHVYHHYPRRVKRVYVEHHYPRPVERVRVEHHYYPVPEPQPVYVEPQYTAPPSGGYYQGGAGLSAPGLIGAAVGGLLGSKVGKGRGNLAATAGGTLAGYLIGSQH